MEPFVPRRRPALALALSLLASPVVPALAQAEEYRCQRGEMVRRVEVQFADTPDRLPCEVVYWKDTEQPGARQVPWNARNELAFCSEKARELVQKLESAGWRCAAAAPSEGAARGDAAAPAPRATRAPAPPQALIPPQRAENGAARGADTRLQAALVRDIRRLDELTGSSSWRFDPDKATLGDLNGDGVQDGAVLLRHEADNGGTSHHLLAYLFDGTTFRPVARVNVEAYYQNFAEVLIEGISDGGIDLLLRVPRAGDPACCPSGERHATFELRNGRLVLAGESESGA